MRWTTNWRGKSRHEEANLEAVAEVWGKRDSDFEQWEFSRLRKKMEMRYILERKLTGLADELDVGIKERESRMTLKLLALVTGSMVVPFTEMEKAEESQA